MRYKDIRDKLKTGDILLFSGKGAISEGIKFFSLSKWSHVGMVYKLEDKYDPKGTVFCWESTTLSDLEDADTGRLTRGVQRVELSERLERCISKGYDLCVRPLNKPLAVDMIKALNQFRHDVSGRPYEKSKIELLRAAWDGLFGENKEDLSSLFCSELVAEAFQRMGLLPNSIASNEYTPKDFSDQKSLKLLNGYAFESQIALESV